ncbi:hypothetical protein AYI70_g6377, partial [Smittium culicis]
SKKEPENPYVSTRIPITNFSVYPELTEEFSSIEKDLFRSQITEKKRKIKIYSYKKTSLMKYNPPPLNDSASRTVKKADADLYQILKDLAQENRPIDHYFYRRIQDSPRLDTSEYSEVLFANTMRALQPELAATVTQKSSNNATAQSTCATISAETSSSHKTSDRHSNFAERIMAEGRCLSRDTVKPPKANGFRTWWRRDSEHTLKTHILPLWDRGDSAQGSCLLHTDFHNLREEWVITPCNRPLEAQTSFEEQNFKMETLYHRISRKYYLTSFDLQDKLIHILLFKKCRKYLRFHWNGLCFHFFVLPFELSLIPLVFTKIVFPVLEWARSKGIRSSAYLYDLLILRETKKACRASTRLVYSKFLKLGFKVNSKKS